MPEYGSVITRIRNRLVCPTSASFIRRRTWRVCSRCVSRTRTAHNQRSLGDRSRDACRSRSWARRPWSCEALQPTGTIDLGVRGDDVIAAAKTAAAYDFTRPPLLPQLIAPSESASTARCWPHYRRPPSKRDERSSGKLCSIHRYFSDYNQLRFDLIGHYSMECEDPSHTSLWATLSPLSELELSVPRLELRNELGLLPAPFFDRRDDRRLTLPIVLP